MIKNIFYNDFKIVEKTISTILKPLINIIYKHVQIKQRQQICQKKVFSKNHFLILQLM